MIDGSNLSGYVGAGIFRFGMIAGGLIFGTAGLFLGWLIWG